MDKQCLKRRTSINIYVYTLPVLLNLTNVDKSFQQESFPDGILEILNQVAKMYTKELILAYP